MKRSREDVIYDVIIFFILTLVFLIVAYPLYFVVISSFSDPVAVAGGKVIFYPIGFTLDGYKEVFKTQAVMRGFLNSLIYTAVGVCVNLAVTIPTSYALSRPDFTLKRPITLFYILTMFVSGGMMPTYIIVRSTGILNTWWSLILPGCLGVYNMIVGRTFFKTNIPMELLPLSGAITAILCLYCGVGHWNSYFSALIYIQKRELWPLQLELRNILVMNTSVATKQVMTEAELLEKKRLDALKEMMKYSLIIISSIPVLIIYPFVQKHFVKGVMIGSVKG